MNQLAIIQKIDSVLSPVYRLIPYTHYGLTMKALGEHGSSLLDVACGNGAFMKMINRNHKFKATGVDIFTPYLKLAKKTGFYEKIVKSNITSLPFKNKQFDVVLCSQAIEHLHKSQGFELMEKLEKIAKNRVVFITPAGELPQEPYDGNRYQRHLSTWYAKDFTSRGYTVVGQGLKSLYGTGNAVKQWGLLSYLFSLLSLLSGPLLGLKPDLGVYIFCWKDVDSKVSK